MNPSFCRLSRYAAISLLWFSQGSTADWPTATPASVGMAEAPLEGLAQDMRNIVDRGERAAIVTLVARHGKVVHLQAYGMADRGSRRPVTPDTIFRMCSMTRPITAAAALMLYEQGKLGINDPVAKYLPAFATGKALVDPERSATEPAKMPISVLQAFTPHHGLRLRSRLSGCDRYHPGRDSRSTITHVGDGAAGRVSDTAPTGCTLAVWFLHRYFGCGSPGCVGRTVRSIRYKEYFRAVGHGA